MWDVLAEDYKASMTAKDCVEKIKKQALPGSVIVLHDNDKFYEKLRVVLPEILEHFSAQGFVFKPFSRAN
jgi:peptidoglycan/xylan/chitin deacetylase (PgdA/CDA1 family)